MGTATPGTTSRRPWRSPSVGLDEEADRAYQWLADTQLPDGSWFNYYLATGVKDPRLDTNVCAYVATGAWHHYVSPGDRRRSRSCGRCSRQGVDFVLRWQRADGAILWSLDPDGHSSRRYALLTGSSSIYHSLRCAVACAERLGHERPDWELAAGRLAHALAHHPEAFAPKHEFAMDWYYPVLSGALSGEAAAAPHGRLVGHLRHGGPRGALRVDRRVGDRGRDRRVRAGPRRAGHGRDGLRLLLVGAGAAQRGRLLLDGHGLSRGGDLPSAGAHTYTAGAIVLAADALSRTTPAAGLFRGECLPSHLDLTEPVPGAPAEPAMRDRVRPGRA